MPDNQPDDTPDTDIPHGIRADGLSLPWSDARSADPRHSARASRPGALPVDPDLDPEDPAEPSSTHRPTPHGARPHRAQPLILLVIMAGGALGTLARYELGLAWPTVPGRFPLTTFTINTSGALALGVVLTLVLARQPVNHYLRPFLGTGLLGGWTTYSTLVVDATALAKGDHLGLAAGYLFATLVAGMAAVAAGIWAARIVVSRRGRGRPLFAGAQGPNDRAGRPR